MQKWGSALVLDSQLSAKISAISKLSVNYDVSQLASISHVFWGVCIVLYLAVSPSIDANRFRDFMKPRATSLVR